MFWFYLFIAGLLESAWAIAMKYANGWQNIPASILAVVFGWSDVIFLVLALRGIPLGVGYAVWVAMGIIGSSIAGYFLFKDPMNLKQAFFIVIILIGAVGLRLTTGKT